MTAPATTIVLTAGAVTFTGEWYWQRKADWKVPLATILLAGGAEALSGLDRSGATLLSVLVLTGALATKFNGHSAFDMITALVNHTGDAATSAKGKAT